MLRRGEGEWGEGSDEQPQPWLFLGCERLISTQKKNFIFLIEKQGKSVKHNVPQILTRYDQKINIYNSKTHQLPLLGGGPRPGVLRIP